VSPNIHASWLYNDNATSTTQCTCNDCSYVRSLESHNDKTNKHEDLKYVVHESTDVNEIDYLPPRIDSPTVLNDSDSECDSFPSTPRSGSTTPSTCSTPSSPSTPSKSLRSSLSTSPSTNRASKPLSFADEHGLSLTIVYEIDEELCQYPIPKPFQFPCQFM
jgi:hypothetical protein